VKRFLKIILGLSVVVFLVSFLSTLSLMSGVDQSYKIGNVAVLEINGVITESLPILEDLMEVRDNDAYKALIVRVNSPGGAVGSSQEIFMELKRLQKDKPVVVSMGDVAASGGLYAALGGEYIYALPGTLTGSMGVLLQLTNVSRLMQKLYVDPVTITSGSLKAAGNPLHPIKAREKAHFQKLINRTFSGFKKTVQESRNLQEEAIAMLADGRVIEGTRALEIGLIDAIGTFEDAVQKAKELGKVQEKVQLAWLSRKPKGFFEKIFQEVSAPVRNIFAQKRARFEYMMDLGF
jgi:protease-4